MSLQDEEMPPLDAESNERLRTLSQRSLALATACLAVTALVLCVALAVGLSVAASAQNDAEDAKKANLDLRQELTCRADITTSYTLAQSEVALASAELTSTIGQGLALVANNSADLPVLVGDLENQAAVLDNKAELLRQAGESRQASMDACEVD